ncbi:MAG: dihydropteroate synthase [Bacteroidia bacterium]|nr:dihydropteroate synthase [Bacteroidia bacterium]
MDDFKIQAQKQKLTINCKGKIIALNTPIVMGIINTTPDSFYEGSRKTNIDAILFQADKMLNEGASILDIGGYSTRPMAEDVKIETEIERVIPTINEIHKRFPDAVISIDTFRSEVAEQAITAGASIINDVSSGEDDENMLTTVAMLNVPYIMMHKRGTPSTMQQLTNYENITAEIITYFNARVALAKACGIKDIIIDPGFGFAKNLQQNYQLLNELNALTILNLPILVGVSRKKMIQTVINSNADAALNGTTTANTIALMQGANILRVHDVKEAMECINIVNATNGII